MVKSACSGLFVRTPLPRERFGRQPRPVTSGRMGNKEYIAALAMRDSLRQMLDAEHRPERLPELFAILARFDAWIIELDDQQASDEEARRFRTNDLIDHLERMDPSFQHDVEVFEEWKQRIEKAKDLLK